LRDDTSAFGHHTTSQQTPKIERKKKQRRRTTLVRKYAAAREEAETGKADNGLVKPAKVRTTMKRAEREPAV